VYISGAKAGVWIDASREVEVMHPGAQFAEGEGLPLYGFRTRHAVSGNMAGWHAGGHSQRGYWGELSHFARACLGQVPPAPTLDDGARAVQIIEAIVESARAGKEVAL
jgi:predicted dehydrogenase